MFIEFIVCNGFHVLSSQITNQNRSFTSLRDTKTDDPLSTLSVVNDISNSNYC